MCLFAAYWRHRKIIEGFREESRVSGNDSKVIYQTSEATIARLSGSDPDLNPARASSRLFHDVVLQLRKFLTTRPSALQD